MPKWLKWTLMVLIIPVVLGVLIEAINRWFLPASIAEAGSILRNWYDSVYEWFSQPAGLSRLEVASIALLIALLFGLYLCARKQLAKTGLPAKPTEANPRPFEPNIIQNKIFRLYWEKLTPEDDVSARWIATTIDYGPNEVMLALDQLFDLGLLGDLRNTLTGRTFFLNQKGRRFCSDRFGHVAALGETTHERTP